MTPVPSHAHRRRVGRRALVRPLGVLVLMVGLVLPGAAAHGVSRPDTGVVALPAVLTSTEPAGPSPAQLRRTLRRAAVLADRGRKVPARTTPSISDLKADQSGLDAGCAALHLETSHELCTFGDTGGERTVVLLGSSHMTMWVPGLEAAAARGGTRVIGLFKYGCAPQVLVTRRSGNAWPECAQWRRWALDRIAEIGPEQVVVGVHTYINIDDGNGGELAPGTRAYDRAHARGTRRLVRRLAASSGDVVYLGDVAERPRRKRPVQCLKRTDRDLARCEHRIRPRTSEMLARDRRATEVAGGRFFDTNRLTCYRYRCPVAAGGRMVFRDFSHVSRTWSVHVADAFATRIRLHG